MVAAAGSVKDSVVHGDLEYTGFAHEDLFGFAMGDSCPSPGQPCVAGVYGTEHVSVSWKLIWTISAVVRTGGTASPQLVDVTGNPQVFADSHITGTDKKDPTAGCPFGQGCPNPASRPYMACTTGLKAHGQWLELGGGGYPSVGLLRLGTAEVAVHLPADIDALRTTNTACSGEPQSIANIGLAAFRVPVRLNDGQPPRIDPQKLADYTALLAPKVQFIAVRANGKVTFKIVSGDHFAVNWHWTAQVSRHQIGNDFSDTLKAASSLRFG